MYDRSTKDNKNEEIAEETPQSFCEKLSREGRLFRSSRHNLVAFHTCD